MHHGFSFSKFTEAEVKSLNVRAELHGKDFVPAIDLGLRITGSNRMLLMFGLGRYFGHYVPADAAADEEPPQAELDGIEPVSDRPKLRFDAGQITIPNEYKGVNVTIDYGSGGKSNIELFGNVNVLKADLHDGGSIDLQLRFQASGVDDKVIGKLGGLVRHKIQFTALRSAEADGTQEQLPGTKPTVHSGADLLAQTPEDALAHASTPATPKQLRDAERAARFPVAAKKTAAKKVVPFKTKAALAARKAAKK